MYKINNRKRLLNIVMFSISIGILVFFCISNNNLSILLETIPSLNHFWLIVAIISVFLSWFFDSLVIKGILSDMYNKKYSYFFSFKLTMVGQYFSAVTPLGVGGQPMQILFLTDHGMKTGVAISLLVRKFLIYQSSMAIYSLLVIITKFNMFSSHIPCFIPLSIIGFISQCFIVTFLILFYINKSFTLKIISLIAKILYKIKIIKNPEETQKKIQQQLNSFVENNSAMRKNKILTLKLYLLTFMQLTALFAIPLFIFKAFHNSGFPAVDMISTQAFVTMISSYTPLPGASGTTEGSFLMLFGGFFKDGMVSHAMILFRLISYYLNIVAGIIIIKIKDKKTAAI